MKAMNTLFPFMVRQAHHERKQLKQFVLDCTESLPRFIGHAGVRAPTVGALGDAGAVAESLSKDHTKSPKRDRQ